jgi:hypothetical protein
MIFAPKGKSLIHQNDLKINGTTIERVKHTKFLGVIIDDQLKWANHTSYIKGKVSRGFGALIKARKVFTRETLVTLYYSLIYPYLSYCIHAWGSAYQCHLYELTVLQKTIIRVICGVPRMRLICGVPHVNHTEPLFNELKILPLRNIYVYTIGLFMFKYLNRMVPVHLFETMFTGTAEIHSHYTRQSDSLYIDRCSTTRSQKNIKFIGARIWNTVITKINVSCTISTFKKHLRSLLQTIDLNLFILW